ncbi:MAG: polysaccharide deacetylase family protein, partial [Polyangiales bacterium]
PDAGGFDDGVVDATTAEFDQQVGILARHFSFVTLEDVRRWLRGGSLPKNPVLLSFDDAYRECRDIALPILQRHRAHAAFFVSTQHVEQRRMFWWDRASFVIHRAKVQRAAVPAYDLVLDLSSEAHREESLRRVLRLIKDRFGLAIDPFLDALSEACGVHWSPELERSLADATIATWDDVRALHEAGMEIQSHTRTHRVLQTLSPEELASELGGAREDLEAKLRVPVRALAYPTGRPVNGRADITRAVRDAGYDLAFENAGGVNTRFLRPSPLMLRRIPMVAGMTPERFETILVLPLLQ